jgi:hypothetical protein
MTAAGMKNLLRKHCFKFFRRSFDSLINAIQAYIFKPHKYFPIKSDNSEGADYA